MLKLAKVSKSTYYYVLNSLKRQDKYKHIKELIVKIFNENKGRYGYRRITLTLVNEYNGHQHYSDGICDSRWKENARQGHPCKHTIDNQCITGTVSICSETCGNGYRLNALQKSDNGAVGRQGKGQGNQFSETFSEQIGTEISPVSTGTGKHSGGI